MSKSSAIIDIDRAAGAQLGQSQYLGSLSNYNASAAQNNFQNTGSIYQQNVMQFNNMSLADRDVGAFGGHSVKVGAQRSDRLPLASLKFGTPRTRSREDPKGVAAATKTAPKSTKARRPGHNNEGLEKASRGRGTLGSDNAQALAVKE